MERLLRSVVVLLLAAGMLGCSSKPIGSEDDPGPAPEKPRNADKAEPADKTAVVRANNRFAFDLFAQLDRDKNLFFSPLSISTGLAMTYGGARGETAEEMARALHFTLQQEKLHPAVAGILWDLQKNSGSGGPRLYLANALWPHNGATISPDFLQRMRDNYAAEPHELDFNNPQAARHAINEWVSKQTRQKIQDMIVDGDLSTNTRLVLANAVYFRGDWKTKFDKKNTLSDSFHVMEGNDVAVSMMRIASAFPYFEEHVQPGELAFQMLELPYDHASGGPQLSLVILMPRKVDGLAEFEKGMSAAKVEKWVEQLRTRQGQVALPKFELLSRIRLNEPLQALGIRRAFQQDLADFSSISDAIPLWLAMVTHQARVEVNESGTVAAAATVSRGDKKDGPPRDDQPIIFRADHPFIFFIRDRDSGCILFIGRVTNPTT